MENEKKENNWIQELFGLCVVCHLRKKRSNTAQTCDQHCAAKLAWETRLK
jgi:hypothetical protein